MKQRCPGPPVSQDKDRSFKAERFDFFYHTAALGNVLLPKPTHPESKCEFVGAYRVVLPCLLSKRRHAFKFRLNSGRDQIGR